MQNLIRYADMIINDQHIFFRIFQVIMRTRFKRFIFLSSRKLHASQPYISMSRQRLYITEYKLNRPICVRVRHSQSQMCPFDCLLQNRLPCSDRFECSCTYVFECVCIQSSTAVMRTPRLTCKCACFAESHSMHAGVYDDYRRPVGTVT